MTRQEFKRLEALEAEKAIRREVDATQERPFPITRRGTLELRRPPMPPGTPTWVLVTNIGGEPIEATAVRVS